MESFFEGLKVKSMLFPKWQDSGRSKGYAHVRFTSENDLEQALKMTGSEIGGRKIDIAKSKGKKPV